MRLLKPEYLLLLFTLLLLSRKSFAQDYVCISTDSMNGQINLNWSIPNFVDTVNYYVLQWSLTSGNWNNKDSIMFPNPSLVTTYTIPSINGNNSRYYFRLYELNTNTTGFEFVSSNIFLTVAEIDKRIAKLDWNTAWVASAGIHNVQRLDNGVWNTIYSIPYDGTHTTLTYTYNDTLTNSLYDTPEIKYRILFKHEYGDCYSISNIKSLDRENLFYMPNAFKPGGINNKFRPVQLFDDPNGFMMQIYDKWGQMIFETTDIIAGWDGNIKGSIAAAGLYVYIIRYKSLKGGEYEKRGTVMLVK